MRKKQLIKIFIFLVFFLPTFVRAGILDSGVATNMAGQSAAALQTSGYSSSSSIGSIVAIVIKAFLGLLGIIFIVLLVLAGYNWMTAAGDEQKVTKAKDTIRTAIIGLVIIMAAWGLTSFVMGAIYDATTGT